MTWAQVAHARQVLSREQGAMVKDWGGKLSIALVFPNTYYVGMSSLGLHSVYGIMNANPDVVCERVFWDPAAEGGSVLALESQRPLADFDVLAFTCSFELDYFHIVDILRWANIPLSAVERDETAPLLIAGGPAPSANPLPIALLFDAIAIGEGETIIPPLLEVLRGQLMMPRVQLLSALADLPGLYVPALAACGEPCRPVRRQWLADLDDSPTTSVIFTRDTEFGDMFLMEVSRGCGRGCRFCLAGHCFRPPRERSPEVLLSEAKFGERYRDRVGLVGAAISDYSQLDTLIPGLRRLGMGVSVSSLRVDPLPEILLEALAEGGAQTLTVAPEAGSQRLRDVIHKGISEDAIMEAADRASGRFERLKLYYMVGLPTELEEDIEALVQLTLQTQDRFSGQITANVTPFVPKAHTSFQWAAMSSQVELERRIGVIERRLRPEGIEVRWESPEWSVIQAVLARGDERVGKALIRLQSASRGAWRQACREVDLKPEDYLRARPLQAPLPWDCIDVGLPQSYLQQGMMAAYPHFAPSSEDAPLAQG